MFCYFWEYLSYRCTEQDLVRFAVLLAGSWYCFSVSLYIKASRLKRSGCQGFNFCSWIAPRCIMNSTTVLPRWTLLFTPNSVDTTFSCWYTSTRLRDLQQCIWSNGPVHLMWIWYSQFMLHPKTVWSSYSEIQFVPPWSCLMMQERIDHNEHNLLIKKDDEEPSRNTASWTRYVLRVCGLELGHSLFSNFEMNRGPARGRIPITNLSGPGCRFHWWFLDSIANYVHCNK